MIVAWLLFISSFCEMFGMNGFITNINACCCSFLLEIFVLDLPVGIYIALRGRR